MRCGGVQLVNGVVKWSVRIVHPAGAVSKVESRSTPLR